MRAFVMAFICVACVVCVNGEVLNCESVFESRKAELQKELDKIAEQRKMMNVLNDEQRRLNDKKLEQLKLQEARVQGLIDEAKSRENNIKNLIKQNEELLAQIDAKKSQKISQTYAKMKDSKASAIIEELPLNEAAEILFAMDSKDIGKIFAKMDAQKAAKLTEMLKKGPPFVVED